MRPVQLRFSVPLFVTYSLLPPGGSRRAGTRADEDIEGSGQPIARRQRRAETGHAQSDQSDNEQSKAERELLRFPAA